MDYTEIMKSKEIFLNKNPELKNSVRDCLRDEVAADLSSFPEDVRFLVEQKYVKRANMTLKQEEVADSVVSDWWQKKYSFPFENREARSALLSKKYEAVLEQKSDLTAAADPIALAESELNDELKSTTVNVGETKMGMQQEKEGVFSAQELKDAEMDTTNSNWFDYWRKRLLTEAALLPHEVREAVFGANKNGALSHEQMKLFSRYVKRRVYGLCLNFSKRKEMFRLKQCLADIDSRKDYSEAEKRGRRTVSYDEKTNKLFVERTNRNDWRHYITLGDIVADLRWGNKYFPDVSVPPNIWRRIRKLSDITETRQKIEHIFNIELSQVESFPLPTTDITEEWMEGHLYGGGMHGIIGERMVEAFLTRIAYDNPALGLHVECVNAFEDAQMKYDIKLRFDIKRRGIAITPKDMTRREYVTQKRRLGFQFTVGKGGGGKLKQIKEAKRKFKNQDPSKFIRNPVDDIVLVRAHFDARACFIRWVQSGKPSGGPEQYLDRNQKIGLFKKFIAGRLFLSEEEIEKLNL